MKDAVGRVDTKVAKKEAKLSSMLLKKEILVNKGTADEITYYLSLEDAELMKW